MKNKIFNLKRSFTLIIAALMLVSCAAFYSCGESSSQSNGESKTNSDKTESSGTSSAEESSKVMIKDENAKLLWNDSFAEDFSGIKSADDVFDAKIFLNGSESQKFDSKPVDGDLKYLLGGKENTRFVNYSDGYMLSILGKDVKTDLSLATLRVKFFNESSVLTVTKETSNPYGNTEKSWNIYLTEWLNRYINDLGFLSANNIMRTRKAETHTDFLPGYTVMFYDMFIKLSKQIEYPYYNIAIIRKDGVYDKFFLLVMKSKDKSNDEFDSIVRSFKEIDPQGKSVDTQGQYEMKIPEYWNDETKAYYNKLITQNTVDWGMFVRSMPNRNADNISQERDKLISETNRLQDAFDYKMNIMPTYMHVGWDKTKHFFPSEMAAECAGGNGFNGKPVLQFSYQFTTLNNSNLSGYTPIFDILRGTYDKHFKQLAQDIKTYGKPVLFRLNNEMNSDWVSYCGIVTLLDPDIFIATWERMYNIFIEEGVDNCIWIFNPIAKSTPFSSWGEALNYMPNSKYVQALGLTSYEMANDDSVPSFKKMYTDVYKANDPYFDAFPWIISEFACGSGGEKKMNWDTRTYFDTKQHRNAAMQAQWVKEMFDCFENSSKPGYEFAKKIKGAVWFSCNDYVTIDGKSYITNNLRLDEELTDTLNNFKDGLARTH